MAGTEIPATPNDGRTWPVAAIRWSGMVVSLLGLTALFGWLHDLRILAGFGADRIPMAPSTALLFITHGILLGLRARPEISLRATWASRAIGSLAAIVACVLFALSSLGIRLSLERLGMGLMNTVQGIPIGHISPATAACFFFASLSALISLPAFSCRSLRRLIAFGSTGVLLGTSCVFLLAYLYGRPLLYGGGFIPPALNTTLAFITLALGLLVVIGRKGITPEEHHLKTHTSGWFLLVFTLLASGLVAAGHFYYQQYERQYRAEVERQLSAVAELKVSELVQWRRERIGDGTLFLGNEDFALRVERCIEAPADAGAQARLEIWLRQLREAYSYDRVFLLGVQGKEIASAPPAREPVASHLRTAIPGILRARQVAFLDLHRNSLDRPIHLSLLVPIYSPQNSARPLGLLVLRSDPAQHLYPMIQRWPTPSQTAETLIVRREGDTVLFLNELRFRQGAALTLREPLSNTRLPAARAVLGYEGTMEGVDYRGVQVFAAVRSVPQSPWSLVARMDAAEVYAPLAGHLWQMVFLVAALLFGAGTALGLIWRQQNARFYQERYEAAEVLRASEARYRALMEHAPVAVFINRQDRVIEANLACLRLFGAQSKEQLLGKSPFELFHPDFHPIIRERIQLLRERGEVVSLLEEKILRLDSTAVDVEVTAAPFLDHDENAIHVVLSDITERKAAERALRASETELRQRNDELTRFTYTVSHDLKSPLVTIQTFLGYLEQDLGKQDPLAVEKDFGFIRAAAQKMSRLLHELLDLSRIGRIKNPPEDILLSTIVEEALALVAGRIAAQNARIEITPEPVILHGDRVRLVEILQNLVDNAVKFMGTQPSPLVEIGVTTIDEETVLFVRDNGSGIDPRHITKLFGLFEKLDPKSEGTGIGLALVRRIVEVHGGRIWVESKGPGHGACFYFTLTGTLRAPGKEHP